MTTKKAVNALTFMILGGFLASINQTVGTVGFWVIMIIAGIISINSAR